jgi:hypothetical protein
MAIKRTTGDIDLLIEDSLDNRRSLEKLLRNSWEIFRK